MKDLGEMVLRVLGRKDYTPSDAAELRRKLRLEPLYDNELREALALLERNGRVARVKGNRYVIPREADLVPGRIRMNRSGTGFLQPDDPGLEEIRIPEGATGTAMHEDRVLVRLEAGPGAQVPAGGRRGAGPRRAARQGRVVRVLERRRTQLVGTLQRGRQFLYVIPDDSRLSHNVYVPEPRDVGRPARVGDKVVVELAEWESRQANPEGEIIEVLGTPDDEGVDMLSVIRNYGLPLHFPRETLEQAHKFGATVPQAELKGRKDCRGDQVVTIDPEDARDFDDAICLRREEGGRWRLWVHIADVSHYIQPGTPLDLEARKRGNSTYLVDRVIPMLPEALSNELCSLKPGVDRLTKCVEFLLSNEGRVLGTRFYPAVIKSQRRFAYPEVFAILQRPPNGGIDRMLHEASALAQRIRRDRFKAGSLDLDFPEMKIRLDEEGNVLRIEKVENDISHQLVEECMLLANEAVAAKLMEMRRPAIYRVHEEPDEDRLNEFREDVLSHHIPCGNLRKRPEVQRLLAKLGKDPIGQALKIGFLRSLMRARYTVEPLGHYGLAKRNYAHFTSPIRRYADLEVHRALFAGQSQSINVLRQTADHISETERNSDDAERDSKDVKLYAFLNKQLASGKPTVYPALVTDLRNFGFFVDVPGLAMSGAVRLSSMDDDFYIYQPERNQLIGRRTRRAIRLGDRVNVQVAKVDSYKKQVDFRVVPPAKSAKEVPGAQKRPGKRR